MINAQHIKAVPGRKTDVKDTEWIAELLVARTAESEFHGPVARSGICEI